jgi:DnaK suppressor protein
MDEQRARELLAAERTRLEQLLGQSDGAARGEWATADDGGDMYDAAEPLTAEATDDAITASIEARLAAVGRAEERLAAGTYGLSVRSSRPIPDERLEADPAAELTVDEADER